MATIKADYEKFPGRAQSIEKLGSDLHQALKESYTELNSLHSNWQGVRFGKLVSSFNEMIPEFNNIISDVSTDIPNVLRTIAQNYGNFDTDNFSGGSAEISSALTALTVPTETAIYFDDAAVEAAKTAILGKFADAKGYITSAKGVVDSMLSSNEWAGTAADTCQGKLTNYQNTVNKSLEQLSTDFETAINNTIADLKAAENANTLKTEE